MEKMSYIYNNVKRLMAYICMMMLGFVPAFSQSPTEKKADDTTRDGKALKEVMVQGNQISSTIGMTSLNQTENLGKAVIRKMACCTLAESFENSASTSTNYSDAVTGAKQIQLLGLSGVYVQTMGENVPTLRGIANPFGMSYMPSSWLDNIQISKGASTVVNGYEAIAGTMNLDFAKPNIGQQGYVDFYTDDDLRTEVNGIVRMPLNDDWSNVLLLHTGHTLTPDRWGSKHDGNKDTFMDMPKVHNYSLQNRWLYADAEQKVNSRFVLQLAYDDRESGQMPSLMHDKSMTPYKVGIENYNFNFSNKTGFVVGSREGQSIGIINSITQHTLLSDYGLKSYDATETDYYGNVIFNSSFSERQTYQTGVSYRFERVRNTFGDALPFNNTPRTRLLRVENVYGAFFEYTNTAVKNLAFTLGVREDYNSKYGWLFTPRANVRYSVGEWFVARACVGRGYRSSNALSENMGVLASSRNIHLNNNLDIEKAWNMGGNIIFKIPVWNDMKATLSLDYYHIDFDNRTVADMDASANDVYFYDLKGNSHSDTWQADLTLPILPGLTFYGAFRYNDQKMTYTREGQTMKAEVPLVSTYKGLLNLQYATDMKEWVIDATVQFNGKTRLPSMNGYASEMRYSRPYPIYFAQVTHRLRRVDVYLGAENIFDFKQKNPVIGWDTPFEQGFDASMVWAPIKGRMVYLGCRWNIGRWL